MTCRAIKKFWRRYFGRLPDPEPPPADILPWDAREAFHNLHNEQQKLNAAVDRLHKRQDAFEEFMNSLKEHHNQPQRQGGT